MFANIPPPMLWAIAAVLLALVEIAAPGVFLIWLAVAAILTAGLTLIVPVSEPFQFIAFTIFSALSVSGGRLWYLARPVDTEDPLLNDRAARLLGREVMVIEAISHGQGRVRIDDGSWTATGPDVEAGSHVVITGVTGANLIVEPLARQIPAPKE